ncbi:MAG: UvrD-helicase domain-containing protein [Chromatiales bacterium]|nr:UvrD-helicase domain-containing protein [Chromatiales bacterium]
MEIPKLALFDKFAQFTTSKLQTSTNKGKLAPQHPFFDACETLQTTCEVLVEYCRYQIPVKLLAWCNAELAIRKRRQQVQSYDDLLLNLNEALNHPRQGGALIETLHRRYTAALIDEFQDTDPVQYAIFQRIYAGTNRPVFLVGDPKQADLQLPGRGHLRLPDRPPRYSAKVHPRCELAFRAAPADRFERRVRHGRGTAVPVRRYPVPRRDSSRTKTA